MTFRLFLLSAICLLTVGGPGRADDVTFLPPPFVEDVPPPPPPSLFFSIDFAVIQPRLRGFGGDVQDGATFSPRLDWTVSPRFEIGFDEAALRRVRSRKYRPARRDDVPVPIWVIIRVEFRPPPVR